MVYPPLDAYSTLKKPVLAILLIEIYHVQHRHDEGCFENLPQGQIPNLRFFIPDFEFPILLMIVLSHTFCYIRNHTLP
jgi:hypothetical protein